MKTKEYSWNTLLRKRRSQTSGTRLLPILVAFVLFLAALLPRSSASIESVELRAAADFKDLLSWSNYEFSVDAATQLFGPLIVRGGADAGPTVLEAPTIATEDNATAFDDESTPSLDETSVDSSHSVTTLDETSVESSSSGLTFSLYQKGDGSETDPDGIPTRYMLMQRDHRDAALKALRSTLEWRKEHDIDHLLGKPQPKFDLCKTVFPHYFVGRDKDGHVVFVQRPALVNLDKAYANGLTEEELLMHYVYVNEYLWQVVSADDPFGTMTSIIDLTGLNMGVLKRRDLIGFVKKFVSTMDAHYPQRSHKTLLVNAPKWFHLLYKLISPMLRETTKAKIEIHSKGKRQDKALKRYLGDDACASLPPSFWSRGKDSQDSSDSDDDAPPIDEEAPPQSELEKDLRSFVCDDGMVQRKHECHNLTLVAPSTDHCTLRGVGHGDASCCIALITLARCVDVSTSRLWCSSHDLPEPTTPTPFSYTPTLFGR